MTKSRLEEIIEELSTLTDEAETILRKEGGTPYLRAKSYCLAQLKMAISSNHSYLGSCQYTLEDAINEEWNEDLEEDEDDNYCNEEREIPEDTDCLDPESLQSYHG